MAVLLANPAPAKREVVCDTDGLICNLWRAIRADPEEVAYHADYPTIHQDLTARHIWLREWAEEYGDLLSENPDFYDAKAAGWWVWGISLWIGGGWCTVRSDHGSRPTIPGGEGTGSGVSQQRVRYPHYEKRPAVRGGTWTGAGVGVSAQRSNIPDLRPHLQAKGEGRGINAQRDIPHEKRPRVNDDLGGRGVSAQRDRMPRFQASSPNGGVGLTRDQIPYCGADYRGGPAASAQAIRTGSIIAWFEALADRLKRVVVLNRDWAAAVTPSVLSDTPSGPGEAVNRCILLDPPYVQGKRSREIYNSDATGESDDIAGAAYRWAIKHGDRYRIAYCCHEGDFPLPDGWEQLTGKFKGQRSDKRGTTDCLMFSPLCQRDQLDLF